MRTEKDAGDGSSARRWWPCAVVGMRAEGTPRLSDCGKKKEASMWVNMARRKKRDTFLASSLFSIGCAIPCVTEVYFTV